MKEQRLCELGRGMVRAAALAALIAAPAMAKPPPGVDLAGGEHRWWECMSRHDATGHNYICCDVSDGHVLKDDEWRTTDQGMDQVKILGKWWDVPAAALVDPTPCGLEPNAENRATAKVWYGHINWNSDSQLVNLTIYCFLRGQMY